MIKTSKGFKKRNIHEIFTVVLELDNTRSDEIENLTKNPIPDIDGIF